MIYMHQGRVQDLKKGGASPIARKACVQIFSHAPHERVLDDSLMTKTAVLGLVAT